MSKAFTKEDDLVAEVDPEEESVDAVPQGQKNYMTPRCAQRLTEELNRLLDVERPEMVKVVSWAAGNGDRSENGDYIYGKRRLREIDRRIRFLNKRLDAAEIIDPASQNSPTVLFGATVTVETEDGTQKTFCIVGLDEIDAKRGHISWISPIAKALLRHKVGDTVIVHMPKGDEDWEILKIVYQSIE